MAKLVEKVYGEALFELACESGRTEELLREAEAVKEILSANPDFEKLMLNPAVSHEEKEKVLGEVWKERVSREIYGTMCLLLQKEHYKQLPLVLEYFISRIREKEKIGIAFVKTAVPLSKAQKAKVEKRLLETTDYRSFEMRYEVDETLLGGMVIRIGDRVVDSSIRTKLENLSRQLYQTKLQ